MENRHTHRHTQTHTSPLPYGSKVPAERRLAYRTAAVERHALETELFLQKETGCIIVMAMEIDVVREETIDSSKIENPDGCFEGRGREALRGGVPRLGQIDGAYPWRHLERGRSSSPTWPYEDKVCRASHSSKSNRGQTGPRTQPQRGEAGLAHNTSPARPRALAPEWIMWRLQIRDPPGWLLGHLPAVPGEGELLERSSSDWIFWEHPLSLASGNYGKCACRNRYYVK